MPEIRRLFTEHLERLEVGHLAAEQVLSILAAETEDAAGGGEPITLGGETRCDRVSFRLARRQVT